MNTELKIDPDEILSVARQFNLTEQQTEIAAKFLAGEVTPFPLRNYPQEIRTFVAFMREKRQERNERREKPFVKFND